MLVIFENFGHLHFDGNIEDVISGDCGCDFSLYCQNLMIALFLKFK